MKMNEKDSLNQRLLGFMKSNQTGIQFIFNKGHDEKCRVCLHVQCMHSNKLVHIVLEFITPECLI